MDRFQKISTPRLWTTPIGYLKISGFPRRTTAVFAGFQSVLIQNLEEFQNIAKNLNGFPGIPVKIYKIWGILVDFQSYLLSNSYRIYNVVHGRVDIFWNSPITFRFATKSCQLLLTTDERVSAQRM